MSEAVDIVLSVVERMNLTDEDRLALIDRLGQGVHVNRPLRPKKMSEKDQYRRKFEKWMIETKKLYPPKK